MPSQSPSNNIEQNISCCQQKHDNQAATNRWKYNEVLMNKQMKNVIKNEEKDTKPVPEERGGAEVARMRDSSGIHKTTA